MKKYTLLLSIAVHVCAVAAVYLSPLLASDGLPGVRTRASWVPVLANPHTIADPPPKGTRRRTVAPLAPTDGIHREDPSVSLSGTGDRFDEFTGLDSSSFFGDGVSGGIGEPPPAVDAAPPALPPPVAPVRPGGLIEPPKKVVDVAPVYPVLAVRSRTEGVVILETTIAEDGEVRDVRVIRSIPLLDAAAIEAVRRWRFTPTRLNGMPVPVLMTVTVAFRLDR